MTPGIVAYYSVGGAVTMLRVRFLGSVTVLATYFKLTRAFTICVLYSLLSRPRQVKLCYDYHHCVESDLYYI